MYFNIDFFFFILSLINYARLFLIFKYISKYILKFLYIYIYKLYYIFAIYLFIE
ncbi:hypothetical protein LY90DRAFT_190203 [Neocallimastix californiae]|uniref:Uncharacterized protein n=1 Tax=Neocallimastix californiae TaxID=1754190 RepID=A0A1Y2EM04_9FUNG|nr:hypothetical protein LY90DRAFT_190203 [Neocallimastix californiae]|eukprot:ORY72620.1 hypothetical protein LY90DRAFT_190203 [Neocallimastix californiae]